MSLFKSKKVLVSLGLTTIAATTTVGLGVGLTSPSFKLNQAANRINASTINLHSSENANNLVDKQNAYAFNVKLNQLGLDKEVDLNGYSVEFSLDLKNNPTSKLNNGILNVQATITDNQTHLVTTRIIEIDGFKKADTEALAVLKDNQQALDLTNKSDSNNEGLTIEEINDQLLSADPKSTKFNMLAKNGSSGSKDIVIRGQVKLDKITNESNKAVFYLSSYDLSNPLRVLKTSGNKTLEAAIDYIKLANLYATTIDVIPVGYDKEQSKGFEDLLARSQGQINWNDRRGNRKLLLQIDPEKGRSKEHPGPVAEGFIDPFVYEIGDINRNAFDANIVVSYGVGKDAKTFSTGNDVELNTLKQAGFSFGIYGKKLTRGNRTSVTGSDIFQDTQELAKLFADRSLNKPAARKSNMQDEIGKKSISYGEVKTQALKPIISVSKSTQTQSSSSSSSSTPSSSTTPENWLFGVDYRFNGISGSNVILARSISLIHLK